MSRFVHPMHRLVENLTDDQEFRETSADLADVTISPRYIGEDGLASSVPPEASNVVEAAGLRISRGAQSLTGGYNAIQTGAGWLADAAKTIGSVRFPAAIVDDQLLTAEGAIPVADATVSQAWDTLDPDLVSVLELQGMTKDRFVNITGDDLSQADDLYRDFTYQQRTQQALDRYMEEHGEAYWLAGAAAATADILTDPVTWLSLGTGSIISAGVKAGAKEATKAAAKQGLKTVAARTAQRFSGALRQGSPVTALAEAAAPVRNTVAAKLLIAGSATGTEGVGFGLLNQMGEHEALLRLGYLEEDSPFAPSFASLGLSGFAAMALGTIGYKAGGLEGIKLTPREYATHNPGSFAATRLENMVRTKQVSWDEVLDPTLVTDLEAIDRVASVLYNPDEQDLVRTLVSENELWDNVSSVQQIAEFMTKAPTYRELEAFIRSGLLSDSDTAVSRSYDQLQAAQADLRNALAKGDQKQVKKLRSKINQLEDDHQAALSEFNLTAAEDPIQEVALERATSRPVQNVKAAAEDRLKRVEYMFAQPLRRIGINVRPGSNWAYRQVGKFGGEWWSPIKAARRAAVNGNDTDHILSVVAAMLDNSGLEQVPVSATGRRGLSIHEAAADVTRKRHLFLDTREKVTKGMNKEQRAEFDKDVIDYVANQLDDASPEVQQAGTALRKFFDDIGSQGIRNGYLTAQLDNYLPVNIRPDSDGFSVQYLSTRLADWWYNKSFNPDADKAPVHLNTLHRMGVLTTDTAGELQVANRPNGQPYLDGIPERVDQLPDDVQARYRDELMGGLTDEARNAVTKRQGRAARFTDDPLIESADRPRRFFTDNAAARRIEQEFWYQREIIDSGYVEVDLDELTHYYERGSGYNIARQEAMYDVFGEPIRLDDIFSYLRTRPDITPEQRSVISLLEKQETIVAGRHLVQNKSPIIRGLSGVARGTVNMGLGLTIAPVELQMAMAMSLFRRGDITRNVKSVVDAMRGVSSTDLRHMNLAYELDMNSHRMFGDIRDIEEVKNPSQHKLMQAITKYEDVSRRIGGEFWMTKMAKSMQFNRGYSMLWRYRDKLDGLSTLARNFDDPKEFRGAVRAAGFGDRTDLVRDLVRAGLADADMIASAKRLMELDPNALSDIRTTYRVMQELPEEELANAELLVDRLRRYGQREAETFVTTASANSIRRSDEDWANMFFQFTSFAQAWYSRTLKRVVDAPYRNQFAYLGLYAMGEMYASILRDVAYGGHSPETVLEKWNEDPYTEMAKVMTRIPFMGPWTLFPDLALSAFSEDYRPAAPGGAAALSFAMRGANATISAAKDIAAGEEISASDRRAARRLIPFWNWSAARLPLGAVSEADEDRQ